MISSANNPDKVKVTILGQVYTIEGDAPCDYIAKVASYVNQKMEDVVNTIPHASSLQIAILAALNIADELFQIKESEYMMSDEIKEKTNMLISMLDEGLIGDIFSNVSKKSQHL
ncbi:MAG TPA: cell division protein ZapA [Spirochaetota bacterium]|nr:cell division protein ZapA [Spirochaetota bacterium]HQL42534.1 cell division protein ZapA [Spirochaetota bacterium]